MQHCMQISLLAACVSDRRYVTFITGENDTRNMANITQSCSIAITYHAETTKQSRGN